MRYLLDTHVLIWASEEIKKLPKPIRQILLNATSSKIAVAAITPWEIAMLASKGRLQLSRPLASWMADLLNPKVIEIIPMSAAISMEACFLPGDFPADPADRMIVATARVEGFKLVTADQRIRNYSHVETIWD